MEDLQSRIAALEGELAAEAPVTRAEGGVLAEAADEDAVLALASARRPLRAKAGWEAVGWEIEHRPVERMRVKLERLVKQGCPTEDQVGAVHHRWWRR
ncbi:hypothetical protein ACFWZ2_41055 [Streptomyces sp. NPDC059002]|uniref:hypothetical protein n=1 Tax=Streptomyces sp. NPDC059002 TaxID=3346690 RepID=UPI003692D84E